MGESKKTILPGEYIAGAEEGSPGENAYSDGDEIYSASFGEVREKEHRFDVVWDKVRHMAQVQPGMELYCMVRKVSSTKAFLDCTPVADVERRGSSIEVSAVLPVTSVRSSYVRDMRDEVRTGDIIKARISKIEKNGVDVSINSPLHGVVKAYCTDCRHGMNLKNGALICSNCGRKEQRKLSEEYPQSASTEPPQ
jgi:exosome complex component CSL4